MISSEKSWWWSRSFEKKQASLRDVINTRLGLRPRPINRIKGRLALVHSRGTTNPRSSLGEMGVDWEWERAWGAMQTGK